MVTEELTCEQVRTAHRHQELRATALTLLKAGRDMRYAGADPELDMLLREIGDYAHKVEDRLCRWHTRGGLA